MMRHMNKTQIKAVTLVTLFSVLSLVACTPEGSGEEATKAEAPKSGFDQTLALQGVTFHVTGTKGSSTNTVTIDTSGLESPTKPIVAEIDGDIVGAEVADLNADGNPEIYVFVSSAGSGSYASLVAYSTNNKKSLTEIHLPAIEDNPEAYKGYMGHDEFAVIEQHLARRFPVYQEGDTNADPTGGKRQLEYKLEAGEAGWVLKLDKTENIGEAKP